MANHVAISCNDVSVSWERALASFDYEQNPVSAASLLEEAPKGSKVKGHAW